MINKIYYIYALFFAKKRYKKFNTFLLHLSLRGLGILNYSNFRISGEKFLFDFLQRNFSLETVFDVGANDGQYAMLYKTSGANIYSFEPNPKSFSNLKKKFSQISNVNTFNFGFSDVEGDFKIYDRKNNEGSQHASIYKSVITEIHKSDVIEVDIVLKKLDTFVSHESIDKISLLKIDTEGNELSVLKGACETLGKSLIDIIHIEFNEMNVISKVFLKDFIDVMPSYNFYRLLPGEFLPINYHHDSPLIHELFAFQNIVAFRKEIDILNQPTI